MKRIRKKIKQILKKLPGFRGLTKRLEDISDQINAIQKNIDRLDSHISDQLEASVVYPYFAQNDLHALSYRHKNRSPQDIAALERAHPLVSIIIISRNGLGHLRTLMNSFLSHDFYDYFEIIYVDNASHDGSVEYIESFQNSFDITVICNDTNMTYSAANNKGAAIAKGEFLLFLNNDIEVTDGWLDELLLTALKNDNAGAVGSKLLYPDNPEKNYRSSELPFSLQHNGVLFASVRQRNKNVSYINGIFTWEPYHIDRGKPDFNTGKEIEACACVTGAVLLLKKSIFMEVHGFDERYNYGYEDVDLCLKVLKAGYINYICRTSVAFHYEFGTQSIQNNLRVNRRRANNFEILHGKWQRWLTQKIFEDKLNGTHLFTREELLITFVIGGYQKDTRADDFLAAKGLATALQHAGYKISFIFEKDCADPYRISLKTDVLVVMSDDYDLSKISGNKDEVVTIAWVRGSMVRWCENTWFSDFNIVLASSISACNYIKENTICKEVFLFPLATNPNQYNDDNSDDYLSASEKEGFTSDYLYLGDYSDHIQPAIGKLDPEGIPYQFRIFGNGWENVVRLAPYVNKLPNQEYLPEIYKNTKIVLDLSTFTGEEMGYLNASVYDALSCGALVLTDGRRGSEELFDGLLPSFDGKDDLSEKLKYYLSHEEERTSLVRQLQLLVQQNHTYNNRAETFLDILRTYLKPTIVPRRIDICSPHPDGIKGKTWGELYFSQSLARELEKLGYAVDIVPFEKWGKRSDAEVVFVLRGVRKYYSPELGAKKKIMWVISRTENLTAEECNQYDYVFFASTQLQERLVDQLSVPHAVMLQCTDENIMRYDPNQKKEYELLYVGNSKGEYRTILRDLMPTAHKLTIFGNTWQNFPVAKYVKSDFIANEKLGQAYHNAKIVLNDHMDSMRQDGIINNRTFDVLASDSFVISDNVPGLEEVFQGNAVTYKDKKDLSEKIDYYLEHPKEREEMAARGRMIVLSAHTFAHRAKTIDTVIKTILNDII